MRLCDKSFKMETCKHKIVFIFVLFLIYSTNGDSSSSSKSGRRYRTKLSLKKSEPTHSTYLYNDTTSELTYPDPTISSRQMTISGNGEFEMEGGDSLLPFTTHMDSWGGTGNHRTNSASGIGSSKHSSQNQLHNALPLSQRYISAEKYDKYNSGGIGNVNSFGSSAGGSSPIYSSYPLGGNNYGHGNFQSYYSNPLLDTLPYYEREREREKAERSARELLVAAAAANKLKALNAYNNYPLGGISPAMAAVANTLLGNSVAPPPADLDTLGDALALASGHGGWGWEKEHEHHHHDNGLNTNALGLLGLLGLLSILSNILLLLTTTTTTVAAGRKRRSVKEYFQEESIESKRQRIFDKALPYLTPVAHAKNGIIPTECTLQGICLTNKLIVKEFGFIGRPAGNRVTSLISKMLGETKMKDGHKSKIETAGLHGRNQRNCQKMYPVCKEMKKSKAQSIPFSIRIEDIPQLLQKFKKLAASMSTYSSTMQL